jgi:hypothetical protein
MIHLCYKRYEWKLSQGACKSFSDKTGLDLYTVFGDYVDASFGLVGKNLIQVMQTYAKLYPQKIANQALHAIISSANPDVKLNEIEDATYRVSWQLSDRPDDLSEPWPVVMYHTALSINDYLNKNLPKKKETDI